ncbi:MAG: sensor domain-containing diguanylate cyclase [Syntrophales bacterium]|jgi:diguanylate cyclase (GGDEF)-like protein|nr:sensor domain-containing diguanylate cyclase [Syntrophales bacterium]MCK9392186.1 sensor domain-containing diguanylate cyclase [Syntrophales bacterium]
MLLNQEDCLIILNYATRLLALNLDREILLERALEALSDFSANKNVALFTLTDDRRLSLEGLFSERHYKATKREVLYEGTPLEEVIINKEFGVYPNLEEAGFPMPAGRAQGGEGCCLCLPLAGAATKIIGLVTIADPIGHHPSTRELQMLIILTTVIAVSLENARLYNIATRDSLTNLYVRTIFDIRMKEEIARIKRHGGVFSILMTDIDHFKEINDFYGHSGGDVVLQELATIFRNCIREDLDIVCRYGGDEFLTLMPETGPDQAMEAAMRIHQQCATHAFLKEGNTASVTISSGLISVDNTMRLKVEELVGRVDKLLYQAKRLGKNRICNVMPENTPC